MSPEELLWSTYINYTVVARQAAGCMLYNEKWDGIEEALKTSILTKITVYGQLTTCAEFEQGILKVRI